MKKFHRACDFLSGVLVMALAVALIAPAKAILTSKTIDVLNGVTIYVDGEMMIPTDVNGNRVETFVYNGTTYVPIRAVSQYLGKTVDYDGTTQSVYIGNVPGEQQYLLDACPPYETQYYSGPTIITMAGQKYTKGFYLPAYGAGYALFNLNGQYSTFSFDIGHIDGSQMRDTTLHIYLDGELAETIDLNAEMMPQHYDISLNGALQMKLTMSGSNGSVHYGFANAVVE